LFGKSFRIGRIFGIAIEIDFSWFIIFILVAWSLSKGYFPYNYPDIPVHYYWIMGVMASLLLFVSVLLHELSHSYVAIKKGIPIEKITLFIFGGVASISREPKRPGVEFVIAAAGPICSYILMLIFWLISTSLEQGSASYAVIKYVYFINGLLATFNLIPGFPLDGGRLLRSALWHFTGNLQKSTLIASNVGKAFAIFLIVYGFLNIMAGRLFSGLWFVVIGFFLKNAALQSYEQMVISKFLSDLTVGKVMSKGVVSIGSGIPVTELIEKYFLHYHFDCFPVVSGGDTIGVVRMSDVVKAPRDKWPTTTVEEVMQKDVSALTVAPDDGVENALHKMAREGKGWLLVLNADQSIAGVLTRSDIMHLLKVKGYVDEQG